MTDIDELRELIASPDWPEYDDAYAFCTEELPALLDKLEAALEVCRHADSAFVGLCKSDGLAHWHAPLLAALTKLKAVYGD